MHNRQISRTSMQIAKQTAGADLSIYSDQVKLHFSAARWDEAGGEAFPAPALTVFDSSTARLPRRRTHTVALLATESQSQKVTGLSGLLEPGYSRDPLQTFFSGEFRCPPNRRRSNCSIRAGI